MHFLSKCSLIPIALCLVFTSIRPNAKVSTSHTTIDAEHYILSTIGLPTKTLAEILKFTEIHHDGTLPSIIATTQQPQPKGWLYVHGTKINHANDAELWPHLIAAGVVNEVVPRKKSYRYAMILGGNAHSSRPRMAFLTELWKRGVRFDELVFLGEHRSLNLTFENTQEFPEEWRSLPVTFVDAKPTRGGGREGPVAAWLRTDPEPGSVLAISSQPHIGYDHSSIKSLFKIPFTIEIVGPRIVNNQRIEGLLDALARWLYQERRVLLAKEQSFFDDHEALFRDKKES